jgi:hypothetical protein
MPACVSTSRRSLVFALLLALSIAPSVRAEEPPPPSSSSPPGANPDTAGSSGGRTTQPEEDDYKQTPYTSFGEFNDEEEAEDTKFFQYGRFFGVSLGLGYEGATGNRGAIYTGGLPAYAVRVHYWFDFNFSLTLGIYSAKHQYTGFKFNRGSDNTQKTDVNIFEFGTELRYYFDTKDATAPVTFAGPFLLLGVGNYTKTETDILDPNGAAKSTTLGFSIGGGLEFPLKPHKVYLDLETVFRPLSFDDDGLNVTSTNGKVIKDTYGTFFTFMASVLFTY